MRSGLSEILTGLMGEEIRDEIEAIKQAEERIPAGIEVLARICQYYKTHESLGVAYTVEDLLEIKLQGQGSKNLRNFLNSWRKVVTQIKSSVGESLLESLFLAQMERCDIMNNDVAHWKRLRPGDPDKTRKYLEGLAWRYLEEELRKNVRQQERVALNHQGQTPQKPLAKAAGAPPGRGPLDDTGPNQNKNVPCQFFFGFNNKKGRCNRGKGCKNSHDRQVYDNYMKQHPNLLSTVVDRSGGGGGGGGGGGQPRRESRPRTPNRGRTGRSPSRSPGGRFKAGRGRSPSRSPGGTRKRSAGAQPQRSPSAPPSRNCGLHILHVVNGAKPCPYATGGKRCKYTHAEPTEEDKAWARRRKGRPERQNSPAAGARKSTRSPSQGSGRRSGSRGRNKSPKK